MLASLYALAGVAFFLIASLSGRQPGRPAWDGWGPTEWVVGLIISAIWPLGLLGLAWSKLQALKGVQPLAVAVALVGAVVLQAGIPAPAAMAGVPGRLVASAEAACAQLFLGGRAPTVAFAGGKTDDLCFDGYALRESAAWRQPIWSAEHLQAPNLPPAGTPRKDPFHAETALPPGDRAELADYLACSVTHDRGHATPVGDFRAPVQRDATFTLANMMAQTKVDNEQPWNHLENGVRAQVRRDGEAWVVTGPHVPPGAPKVCGRLPEPDAIWKAVYFPRTGVIGAYWSTNDASKTSTTITVTELMRRTSVDPFPTLSTAKKAEVHRLPAPIAGGS